MIREGDDDCAVDGGRIVDPRVGEEIGDGEEQDWCKALDAYMETRVG